MGTFHLYRASHGARLQWIWMKSARTKKTPAARKTPQTVEILREPRLTALPWLVHGFSTRAGGHSTLYGSSSLNLGFTSTDSQAAVKKNRNAFVEATAWPDAKARMALVTMKQVHSDHIHVITHFPGASKTPLTGDGMVTSVRGLLLAIQTADCLPILLVDNKKKVVAAVHAGWRGSLQRIAQKAVGVMQSQFACEPRDIFAAIGPGIHRCCYSVGVEVRSEFESQFEYAGELFDEVFDSDPVHLKYPLLFLTARAPGHSELGPQTHLDLVRANLRQLEDAGVPAKNVAASPFCTACRTDILFSHRAERGHTGRMMAAIGINS